MNGIFVALLIILFFRAPEYSLENRDSDTENCLSWRCPFHLKLSDQESRLFKVDALLRHKRTKKRCEVHEEIPTDRERRGGTGL